MACLKELGTQPEDMEVFMIVRIKGLMLSKAAFKMEVGTVSPGQVDRCMCDMIGGL